MENPSAVSRPFPIVAVGASAGGLAAFEAFFVGVAQLVDPGMAFVLVQHLDPVHKSLLPELVRGFTALPVVEAGEGMPVEVNCVYTSPPGRILAIQDGVLHLETPSVDRGHPLAIDRFFLSLADDRGPRAAAVVLSGTGTDGAEGVRAIHRAGGFVLAQNQAGSEFGGMPLSATETGKADAVLPAEQMAQRLFSYFETESSWSAPELKKVFAILQASTAHDFSQYKPSTIQRRIERRMAFRRLASLSDYRQLLEANPEEVEVLFGDLLIGVTSFFRDPGVFQTLETRIIVPLLATKPEGVPVRVWSAGCSTGEEAYSLAILLREAMDYSGIERRTQVFATDIDRKAIDAARAGIFPEAALTGLPPDRVKKFFLPDPPRHAYRVSKSIRDLVVFSDHDLIKDPPFFKLDLLVCRNLLIYLSLELQRKIIPMFHYALNPGGILVLGSSETIGDFGHLFEVLDRSAKIYVRRETRSTYPHPDSRHGSFFRSSSPLPTGPVEALPPQPLSLKTLTEQTILRVQDMAAALVNTQGEVLYLHGRTGSFFEPPPGLAGNNNVLKMAKDGLKYPLATALHQATIQGESIHVRRVPLVWRKQTLLVHVAVHPVEGSAGSTHTAPLFLVLLEEEPRMPQTPEGGSAGEEPTTPGIEALQRELAAKDEYLKNTTDEMEASNEELRSSNEELQSVNEELQSSNEELETSKEELQSVNEELSTVNAELQSKVTELTTTNNDMNNLLSATGIATVFLDLSKNILRFTPEATRIINLIPSDLGRPVGHLASNLPDYSSLEEDTQRVLDTLIPQEREVRSRQNAWYRLKIQPYRTVENVIEGAVLSFIDITEIIRHRGELEKINELLRRASPVGDQKAE